MFYLWGSKIEALPMTSEKEKCGMGILYDANNDAELIAERQACKDLCYEYNRLLPSETKSREEIIVRMFGKTGRSFLIEQPFFCDYGYNIEIGENFYANVNCVILDAAKVRFGDNVFIAPNCGFYTAGHPFDVEQRNLGLEYARPITIGNNVWIGAQVCVLPWYARISRPDRWRWGIRAGSFGNYKFATQSKYKHGAEAL